MKKLMNIVVATTICTTMLSAVDLSKAFDQPDATKMIKKDLLTAAVKYKMPKGCITTNKDAIARGSFYFHNLNGKKAKGKLPKGVSRTITKNGKKKKKQYGNCVACHNIEGAKGGGTVGPDLTDYKSIFMDSKVRSNQFVFQKIADARIDNKNTTMTINLTTKLFNVREICDITSYIVSKKK